MSKIPMFGLFLFAASAAYADIDQVTQSGQWGTVCPPDSLLTAGRLVELFVPDRFKDSLPELVCSDIRLYLFA